MRLRLRTIDLLAIFTFILISNGDFNEEVKDNEKLSSNSDQKPSPKKKLIQDIIIRGLPTPLECSSLPFEFLNCSETSSIDCVYGESISVNCSVREWADYADYISTVACEGERSFVRSGTCRFCYQTPEWMHICTPHLNCRRESAKRLYKVNCTVPHDVLCLGARTFFKNAPCNWTSGYKWNTAMILSLTLGGFGIDRFYLGHFREGLGKLFSFGGLGIWTLVDVVLIYVGYVGPSDGSIYI